MNYELCFICDHETGRAGIDEDSIYDKNGNGPYCEECYEKTLKMTKEQWCEMGFKDKSGG
tara:strand:+ start:839 stop:1018 length:180 start_codon:yes stop_codon:yes gene_type:complete